MRDQPTERLRDRCDRRSQRSTDVVQRSEDVDERRLTGRGGQEPVDLREDPAHDPHDVPGGLLHRPVDRLEDAADRPGDLAKLRESLKATLDERLQLTRPPSLRDESGEPLREGRERRTHRWQER